MSAHASKRAIIRDGSLLESRAIVEIPVLLESEQLKALEAAAHAQGLTAGALVRCLLRDFLSGCAGAGSVASAIPAELDEEDTSVFQTLSDGERV